MANVVTAFPSHRLTPSPLNPAWHPGLNWSRLHVLVTGGTRGLGRALVKALLARGAFVTATGTDEARLAAARRAMPQVRWLACDLIDPAERQGLVHALAGLPLDAVIHHAGLKAQRHFDAPAALDDAPLADELDLNLLAPIALTRALWPALRQSAAQRRAGLVAFAPAHLAHGPHAASPVHQAAQAGLQAFAQALRAHSEACGDGVRVLCAEPGAAQPVDHWAPLYDAANTLLDALDDGDDAWAWNAPGATQRSLGAALAGSRAY